MLRACLGWCRDGSRQRAGAPPQERFEAEAMFGFVVLCFTINLTETFFLRSTDFLQITLPMSPSCCLHVMQLRPRHRSTLSPDEVMRGQLGHA
jgi:hypothetical protein